MVLLFLVEFDFIYNNTRVQTSQVTSVFG